MRLNSLKSKKPSASQEQTEERTERYRATSTPQLGENCPPKQPSRQRECFLGESVLAVELHKASIYERKLRPLDRCVCPLWGSAEDRHRPKQHLQQTRTLFRFLAVSTTVGEWGRSGMWILTIHKSGAINKTDDPLTGAFYMGF